MKATATLAGLSLPLLLAGCGNAVTISEVPNDCPTVSTQVTLEYGRSRLSVDPECIQVEPGATVTLTVGPVDNAPPRPVKTKYTGFGNWFLDEENESGAGVIMLQVPDEPGKQYKYDIIVRGLGRLDPRIVVP
jgi:hypothetical protein